MRHAGRHDRFPEQRVMDSTERPDVMSDPNYGINEQLKQKQEACDDKFLVRRSARWIEEVTERTNGVGWSEADRVDDLAPRTHRILNRRCDRLPSGFTTARFYAPSSMPSNRAPFPKSTIRPGLQHRWRTSPFFINAARDMEVPPSYLFETADLFREKNISSVIKCIYALRKFRHSRDRNRVV